MDGLLPRVQNFKVLKVLGKGSYGKVYKVQRNSDDQFYALKETDMGSLSQVERMDAVNEIRLLVSISHPNVIRYNEAFLNNSKLCVIMEYAPFGDLRYYISKGQRLRAPFPEEAIWRIFLQLCRGLASLHANHIIHRDIKPANIFLCANDLLKIGDLGIAKALTKVDFARTQIGTPCYMAPEVWSGRSYSYSSDLWSLGCVLYEMMTFRTPMEGRSMQELKIKICAGRFVPVSGKYSPELINFCHQLLSLDPKKRPGLEAILNSSAAAKWMRVIPAAARVSSAEPAPAPAADGMLLGTIMVPRNLRDLPKKLPPPSYESDKVNGLRRVPSAGDRGPAAEALQMRPQSRGGPGGAGGGRAPSAPREHGISAGQMKIMYPVMGGGLQRQHSAGQSAIPMMKPAPRRVSLQ